MYDLARNVEFTGYFQTMTTKAAITMEVKFNFEKVELIAVK